MSNLAQQLHDDQQHSTGGRLVTADGRTLPLKGASLTADAKAGVVRVTLEQHFVNPYDEPLEVSYQMPLPADGAVSGFAFRIGDRRIVGEVDTKTKAKQRFEEAILDGRTAALLDQERSSLFTQRVGNIPPHTEVVSELTIDQKLAFMPEGSWEWRFPTVVAPRYLGAVGRVADAARVTVDVADAALPVKLSLQLSIRDRLPAGARPESPSHSLHSEAGVQRLDVNFADGSGASLDRDVVVRWQAAAMAPGVEVDTCRPLDGAVAASAFGLVTLVPPVPHARYASVPRDLIILLDTSGSMGGQPLDQARRVASALVDSLDDADFLELIEFSNSARRWKWRPAKATASNRRDAQAWLSKLQASGGTEMKTGILEALQPLRRDAQRQVVLMTDGQIGFEEEVVQAICDRLPSGSRVHTVGIGSGVNRSLTMPAARSGRGVEQIIGLGEDAERAAQRILARTVAPLVTNVELSGSALEVTASRYVGDLYAGAPSLIPVQLKASGGDLQVRGFTAQGEFSQQLHLQPIERGEGSRSVACLFARELVEDLELQKIASRGGDVDARITQVGLDFQISTRLTSWVAISEEATVDPRAPRRKSTVPQELPYGMSAEGLGLRPVMLPQLTRHKAAPPIGYAGSATTAAGILKGGMDMLRARVAQGSERLKTIDSKERGGFDQDDEAPNEGAMAPPSAEQFEEPMADEPVRREVAGKAKREAGRDISGATPPKAPARAGRPSAAAPAPAPKARPQSPRELKARVVLLKDGRLAVEITLDGEGLDWNPTSAQVQTTRGSFVGASIDATRTTAAVLAQAGMTLTLVLEVPADLADPQVVYLVCSGQSVLLNLK